MQLATRTWGIVLGLLICAATSRAEDAAPLYDFREQQLENGLRVITLEDFSCPIVAVHLWYHVGSKDENPQRNGFAHMFEHMMFRGTDRLGPTDHFDLIRRVGGDCNAFTAFDNTTYIQTFPSNQLELVLWLEAERMSFLKIDQTAFDTERKVVEEERRLGLNQPYGNVPEQALTQIFTQHPYRWLPIGNIAHLRAASVQELRDFWTTYYVPNNATLVIVGAVKNDDAQALARKYFSWIPRYPDPARVTVRDALPSAPKVIKLSAENAPAPVVGLAWRTVEQKHPDGPALQMLATILGGGDSSRLYRKIVAEQGAAAFTVAGAFSLEQDGLIGAGAVLNPFGGDAKEVMETIRGEVTRLRDELVSEQELEKARNGKLSEIVAESLTVTSKALALGQAAVLEGDTSRVNRKLADVRAVTREDIQRVARQYMSPESVHEVMIERNLLGSLASMLGGKRSAEENAPITAAPETSPPAPGRPGLTRPDGYAAQAPLAQARPANPIPEKQSATLANGLKVIVVPNHEAPYVTIELGLRTGAWTDEQPGAASMALGMLTRGTEKKSEAQLAEEMEHYAIQLGGAAGIDNSSVSASCVSDHAERAVTLLAEVIRTPSFPDSEFQKLRTQTRTGLAIQTETPAYQAGREFRKRLYGEHPYARTVTGEPSELDQLEVEDAQAWWRKNARPDLGALVFAGDISFDAALKLAKENFESWTPEGTAPNPALPAPPPPAPTRIYLVDRPVQQCEIRAGHLAFTRDHGDYFPSRVLNGYFGGAFSSRLNEKIRVEKGLTYGARGGFDSSRLLGKFEVSTFSKVESAAQTVGVILDELKRVRDEPPSEKELVHTRDYIIGSFAGARETPQAVADDLWLLESQGLPADYFETMLKAVAATSAEDCARIARENVKLDQLVVVVVGPAGKLQSELEKLAPVTLVAGAESDPQADEEIEE